MILQDQKVFFIHIPKTAGTTVEKSLNKGEWLTARHYTFDQFLATGRKRKDFTIFTIVRNPHARIYSVFQWLNYLRYERKQPIAELDFKSHIKEIEKYFKEGERGKPHYVNGQIYFVPGMIETFDWWTGGIENVDHILKFENLEKDANKLFEETGLKIDLSIKENVNPYREDYTLPYTDKLRRTVAQLYLDERLMFNYKFK